MPTTHTNPPVTVESQLRDALDMILGDIDAIRRSIDNTAARGLDTPPMRNLIAQWEAEEKGLVDAYNKIARRTGIVAPLQSTVVPF